VDAFRRQFGESAAAFKAVFANPNLRRLQLAAAGSVVGYWAYAVGVSVYAFDQGGAKAVGLIWIIRTVPAALLSPPSGVIADRFRRELVMITSDLSRAVLVAVGAILIWRDAPAASVYVVAGLVAIAGLPFYPAQQAIVPSLANTPTELTAANVVASAIESAGFFVGPALAGILLGITSISTIFIVTAVTFVWSGVNVSLIRRPEAEAAAEKPAAPAEDVEEVASALSSEVLLGFKTVLGDQRLRILVGLLASTTLVVGAVEVLTVSSAINLLGMGRSGVGYLSSAFGIGALVAAFGSIVLVGYRRLSIPFIVGAVLWGPPIALVGIWPRVGLALVCFGLLGAANTLVDVAGFTLVQRAVPDAVLARVFGVLEMIWKLTMGIGAIITPALISGFGLRATLVITGCFVPVLLVLFGPRLVRIDEAATAPDLDRLALLQRTPIFAPLPGGTLENLAARLIPLEYQPGAEIIREGDPGDRFYLVSEGRVDVKAKGAHIAGLGPGDYVGEIALLRDVPRTATVTALTPVKLFALERDDFLRAVTGHASSREAVESTVASRLEGLQQAASTRVSTSRL
jgi:MFS family permease